MTELATEEAAEEAAEIKRPKEGTKTRALWDLYDQIRSEHNEGNASVEDWETPSRATCIAAGKELGSPEATCASQYASWRKAYGFPTAPRAVKEEAVEEAVEEETSA